MIKLICKGAVIGIANIIPGVSGGTMMVVMGIYDKLIHAITHIISEWKEALKLLIPVVIGMALGIVALTEILTRALEVFPVQTNFLFIGLIIGGLPVILTKLKETGKKLSAGNIAALVVFFLIVVGFALVGEAQGSAAAIELNAVQVIKLFFVGVIASATMVIPGVSGSMVLMLIGYYYTILDSVSAFMHGLVGFDLPVLLKNFGILFPFGIGVLVGIVVIAKLIEIVFVKFPDYAYCAIIGLIVASPIAIVLMSDLSKYNLVSILTGLVTLAIGYVVAGKLGEN
jgi:putative membrane protein